MEKHNDASINMNSHNHTHDSNKTNKPSTKHKTNNKIFIIVASIIYIVGTLIPIFIFSKFYRNYNDQVTTLYLHVFIFLNIAIADFLLFTKDSQQTNLEILIKKNPRRSLELEVNKLKNFCEFCKKYKFERSSHCSQCNVCILRRDHHCVWIGKCVGFSNTQYFLNKLIWSLAAAILYIVEFINFYNNQEDFIQENPELNFSFIIKFAIYLCFFFAVLGTVGINLICFSQFSSLFNETTQLERTRNYNLEYFTPFCKMKNLEQKDCLIYNKGFVHNFCNLIGSTFFHLVFPIPRFSKYDLNENEITFSKAKFPHAYEVRKNLPSGISLSDAELKDMDPNNFLELALKKYEAIIF